MKIAVEFEPLIEFGLPVCVEFRDRTIQAQSDPGSGCVFFEPPIAEELYDFYQEEFEQVSSGNYDIEADYEAGNTSYQAGRIIEVYCSLVHHMPRTSFELGCAYGGVVAEMARRGIDAQGSDINKNAISKGAACKGNKRIFHADNLEALARLEGKVDLIYSIHTLEHDPELFQVIRICREKLSEHGLLFISVPNAMFLGSVLGGFRNNLWVGYPQHLHMLSAGFIPSLCRWAGFFPVYWDTRIIFEVDPNVINLFNESLMTQVRRDLWTLLLAGAGFGMELNFALAAGEPPGIPRFMTREGEVKASLERARQKEIKIRRYLQTAPPGCLELSSLVDEQAEETLGLS
jgi:SAM-dependent methyltransferase